MDAQESLEILRMQPNAKKQYENTRREITKGIAILRDYTGKMDRAIEMIVQQTPGFDVSDLEDTRDKCSDMVAIVAKKETAVEEQKGAPVDRPSGNRYGLTRDEQRILDNWEEQMKEIVG